LLSTGLPGVQILIEPGYQPVARLADDAGGRAQCFAQASMNGPARSNAASARDRWVSGQGIGEWIVLEFDKPRSSRGLAIRNGYAKNDDIYRKNSRVKDVELTLPNGESLKATLADRADEQHVTLKRPAVAKWVQLTIRSVYRGWKYSDTAINEVRVDGN
jgi:hypothetical protein